MADRIAIVAAELGGSGARLVALDEHGDRRLELIEPATALARDTNPAVSPDGRWVVFASSRGRSVDKTSLWLAPLSPVATPVPLTLGAATDGHPTWTPDGGAIVFESKPDAGNADLYRIAIVNGCAAGVPERLTTAPADEVTPSVAPDGTIVYAAITAAPSGEVESHLEERAPDGTITRLTAGPADTSPAVSRDGKTIAFSRPVEHGAILDAELWLLPHGSTTASQLVDLPLTDESGPVWSPDGRFVLATSGLRGARGNVVFSSVIVVDLAEHHRRARILEDRVGAIARLTPAFTPTPLDAAALDENPEYLSELARIVAAAIVKQQQ